ncbi:ATP-binding protein [Mycobacterium sp. 134]|uniref:ATP-binding protein n=1 Tax=Mycobacterium sp. 134 TaxID=3400425 RepID=UPI003AAE2350
MDASWSPNGEEPTAEVLEGELLGPRSPVLGKVISEGTSPSFTDIAFRLEANAAVFPGELVAAHAHLDGADAWVVCRVLDVHEVNPHEDALSSTVRDVLTFDTRYAPEGSSTVIYRIAACEPVEEIPFDAHGLGSPHEVRTLPLAGGTVVRAEGEMISRALGLLADPHDGVDIGVVHGTDTPAVLVSNAIQRHMLIVGGTGSGKSYTRGVLAEELHCLGTCQVNIDVNREMVDATAQLGGRTLVPGDDFTLALSSLTREDVLEMVEQNGIRRGTNMETLIGAAIDALHDDIRFGRRQIFGVDDLVDQIEAMAPAMGMQAAGTLHPAKTRTAALRQRAYIGAPTPWRALLQPGAVVNIDCWSLSLSDLRIVVAGVARELQYVVRNVADIPFVALSIDEFHLVCPNEQNLVSTQVLREIARIGRHFGLGLILTTQSPADVDRAILKRLLTRFVHTIEPDQLDSLKGVFADAPPEIIHRLPRLPVGTCLLSGVAETVRHATVVDVRRRRTSHGGHAPDMFATIRKLGWAAKKTLPDHGA